MTSILSERALLIRPSISVWRGEITDRLASRETAERAKADAKSVRTSKFLIARDAIEPILQAANSLRSFVRLETLPWRWDGVSLLPTANYFPFMEGWRSRRQEFDNAVGHLTQHWYIHVARGKASLGALGHDYDYPDRDQVKHQFGASLEMFPVPDAADFRAEVTEAEAEEIRQQLEVNSAAELTRANEFLWTQMGDCVGHIIERLSAYRRDEDTGKITGKFHDTLIGNLRDLVDRLSRLNITNDPQIEAMRQRLASSLCAHDPDELRADEGLRQSVKDEAERIADEMNSIWSGRIAA